jgi:hypothetical protein
VRLCVMTFGLPTTCGLPTRRFVCDKVVRVTRLYYGVGYFVPYATRAERMINMLTGVYYLLTVCLLLADWCSAGANWCLMLVQGRASHACQAIRHCSYESLYYGVGYFVPYATRAERMQGR